MSSEGLATSRYVFSWVSHRPTGPRDSASVATGDSDPGKYIAGGCNVFGGVCPQTFSARLDLVSPAGYGLYKFPFSRGIHLPPQAQNMRLDGI